MLLCIIYDEPHIDMKDENFGTTAIAIFVEYDQSNSILQVASDKLTENCLLGAALSSSLLRFAVCRFEVFLPIAESYQKSEIKVTVPV